MLGKGKLEKYGIEDCRVTQVGDAYPLTFTEVSESGVGVGLCSTTDWRTFVRRGMIFPPHNKDCAVFEERIGGEYYALHSPRSPVLAGNLLLIMESSALAHVRRPTFLGPS